ncbi:flagellin N-terminal helical domain-containing protein [Desulfofundulus thermocisternus]|uniref:flagellin N-terminal helical domain-containing protein n=1 Tax=Desulfofundulus thermocisternus TaxID=42471 RepID=UPI000489E007|nr:flagellin [Desulfofundulus thermocisternus]
MRINHNISALNAYRQLYHNNNITAKSLEKLSSGLRINRAGDDAAGLAISEKMRAQIRGLDMAVKNAQDGISLIQTAEGALNETHSILQRMRELAVQAASDTNTNTDRAELQKEIEQLITEIDRIANTTEFNTKKLLNGDLKGVRVIGESVTWDERSSKTIFANIAAAGTITENKTYNVKITGMSGSTFTVKWSDASGATGSGTIGASGGTVTIGQAVVTFGSLATTDIGNEATFTYRQAITALSDQSLTFHIGANSSQTMGVAIEDMSAKALHVDNINVTNTQSAQAAISAINHAIEDVSAQRAKLGAFQNRLEHTINNLGTSSENLTAAESRIRDVDMAKEMMEFTKATILSQAATAMLAQANQQPQGVLQLLR